MSRNFFLKKTGHLPSDVYFKNQAIWCDSDMAIVAGLGFVMGISIVLFIL